MSILYQLPCLHMPLHVHPLLPVGSTRIVWTRGSPIHSTGSVAAAVSGTVEPIIAVPQVPQVPQMVENMHRQCRTHLAPAPGWEPGSSVCAGGDSLRLLLPPRIQPARFLLSSATELSSASRSTWTAHSEGQLSAGFHVCSWVGALIGTPTVP